MNRTNQILELLTQNHKIEVSVLANTLGVSQVTIRKDLDALEQRGIIRREHGSAVLRSSDDINGRIAYHYDAKVNIARRAAQLVSDGDTIMIESGSCCAILADLIAEKKRNVTILTNSAFIASYIRGREGAQVVLMGGIYQPDSQVMVGPLVKQCAENFCVDRFFIGTDGYSPRTGFTNCDQLRAQAVRDMAGSAEHVIVLTESEKFQKRGVIPLSLGDRAGLVITDAAISEEMKEQLLYSHINVLEA